MADQPSLGALYKTKDIVEADVAAAVDAYMADPATGEHRIGGYLLDLGAAVLASKFATDVLAAPDANDRQKRHAVRTALLLAAPTKAKG